MNQVSKGLMGSPSTPKVKDVVIGSGKPTRLSKNPWECRIRIRMGQGWRRKGNGPRMLKEEEMGQEIL